MIEISYLVMRMCMSTKLPLVSNLKMTNSGL